jgi:hypothetical protein
MRQTDTLTVKLPFPGAGREGKFAEHALRPMNAIPMQWNGPSLRSESCSVNWAPAFAGEGKFGCHGTVRHINMNIGKRSRVMFNFPGCRSYFVEPCPGLCREGKLGCHGTVRRINMSKATCNTVLTACLFGITTMRRYTVTLEEQPT